MTDEAKREQTGNPAAIAVVGAGTMGAGIAQLAATHGCTVHLIDVTRERADAAIHYIAQRLDRSVKTGKRTTTERDAIVARLHPRDAIEDLGDVGLAIEAVVEDLDVKRDVFAALERATPEATVLATNTSSLSVTQIAESLGEPSRVVGMHFFNPAPVMALVEIIKGEQTGARAIAKARRAASQWGKVAVVAADAPGFIVNRVARGFYLEALRLLGEGVAGVDEIDTIMRDRGGFRMGPFQLMDLVGLDVNLTVSTSIWQRMDEPARLQPHAIQQALVAQGHLGRKTGRGFYSYEYDPPLPACAVDRGSFDLNLLLRDTLRVFCESAGVTDAGTTEQYVFGRILAAIINEAGMARFEEVASLEDIDTAMRKGTNYPLGPLEWAEKIGLRTVRGLLKRLDEVVDDGRYEPAFLFR